MVMHNRNIGVHKFGIANPVLKINSGLLHLIENFGAK